MRAASPGREEERRSPAAIFSSEGGGSPAAILSSGGGESPAAGQRLPAAISRAMWSACRMARATIVSVGFSAPPVVKTEPSET